METEMDIPPPDPLPAPPEGLSFGEVALQFVRVVPGHPSRGFVPYYHFRMLTADGADVGFINLRVGNTEHVRVSACHVGFEVAEGCRGHGNALQGCRALAPFVRSVCGAVTITCTLTILHPGAQSSALGAEFMEKVAVPEHDPHYSMAPAQRGAIGGHHED
jgi:hypothetical protein